MSAARPRVLLLDNYDSFVFNAAHALAALGAKVVVVRSDAIPVVRAEKGGYTHLVISPGPGTPDEAGRSIEFVRSFAGRIPILGICLGHQAIGRAFGGTVGRGPRPFHGKASPIHHDGRGVLRGLPDPFEAGRYHSLVVFEEGLPPELLVTARTSEGVVMGIRHREHPVEGVQFHPESILTPLGGNLFRNFLTQEGGLLRRATSGDSVGRGGDSETYRATGRRSPTHDSEAW
ncbi:MAG TPA: aminodeoxychorismate/anthranilate synthase component II [Planctomycetota bacterium]|jgi:anthranilate synthase component 2/para-aminobenzoate synthetase component 2|nr:aminodeoxychorismate/anthranilate synthase component II [Planctomycetota bacterium]